MVLEYWNISKNSGNENLRLSVLLFIIVMDSGRKGIIVMDFVKKPSTMPPNIISCNYKDVLTGRVHVFDLTNLC
jgi:hypothetical protein